MKSGKSWWGIIGSIVLESILFVEIAVELYTGEMTCTDLVLMLSFCLLLAVIIHSVIMRKKRKNRGAADPEQAKKTGNGSSS